VLRVRFVPFVMAFALAAPAAMAQSEALSQVSAISVAPSAIAAGAGLSLVVGVGELTVLSLHAAGDVVVATVRASSEAVAFTLELSAEAVRMLGIAVGTSLEVVATAAGWIILSGSEAVAFVPDATAAALIHHREIE